MTEEGRNDNLSVLLCGKEDVRFRRGEIPVPGVGEVVVSIKKCGICGTDLHLYQHGEAGGTITIDNDNPFYIGHECSGIVHTIGPGVTNLKPGDRVALELGVPCRRCSVCKEGKGNLCKPWSQGGLNRYLKHQADYCHKLPDSVSLEQGALMEPLAVTVRACQRAGVQLGHRVLVCGAGAIGICALLTAKAMGAATVCITDLSPSRLELAATLGADCTVLVDQIDTGESLTAKILQEFGQKADRTIECCGALSSVQGALKATASGGVMTVVALNIEEVEVPIIEVTTREVDVKGVFSYHGNNYPAAIAMVASGQADPSPIITHRARMADIVDALEMLRSPPAGVVKVMVDVE